MFLNGYPYTDFHELNLDWIVKHFKEFVDELASLDSWRSQHEAEFLELKKIVDEIEVGNFPDVVYDKLYAWIQANAYDIIGNMIQFITVGLTDNGYFVLNIPTQWKMLIFNTTGYDINIPIQPEFGHLTISY